MTAREHLAAACGELNAAARSLARAHLQLGGAGAPMEYPRTVCAGLRVAVQQLENHVQWEAQR